MNTWKNSSGKQLSSEEWLLTHHNAKLKERTDFIKKRLKKSDKTIIDLGCGSGLWMKLIDQFLNKECKLIGVDSDETALFNAKQRLMNSNCSVEFIKCNIEIDTDKLPNADLILLFNMSCYIKNLSIFLEKLRLKLNPNGRIIIRQYDGNNIRIGPMDEKNRQLIDSSLFSALVTGTEFRHYDLDRVFKAIGESSFKKKVVGMENYFKKTPYTKEVKLYLNEHIKWMKNYLSEDAKYKLDKWVNSQFEENSYCSELDLIAILS